MGIICEEQDKIQCVKHGALLNAKTNFYITGEDSVYSGIGRIPVCKNCIKTIVENYYDEYKDVEMAVFFTCRKLDIAFDSGIFEGAMKNGGSAIVVFQSYMRQRNSIGSVNGTLLSFDSGEDIEVSNNNEVVNSIQNVVVTDEDRENKYEVIEILGYDPFEDYVDTDAKFLYSDLINYLSDDEVADDQYKVSQIIQVVVNNDQVRKINATLSQYTNTIENITKHEGKIKSLNAIKNDIVKSTTSIAKENAISVSSRGGKGGGKSSLTLMTNKLRELNFKDAEVDYYDQMLGYGMQRASDISTKSIMEQLNLDEADSRDMLLEQRAMIKDFQEKELKLEEELRLAKVELSEIKKRGGDNG